MDEFDQFPDAPQDEFADFPDAQPSEPAPSQAAPSQPNTWGQAIKNVAEAGAQLGTGVVGGLVGDVAGLGALGYDIAANAVMHPFSGSDPGGYADSDAVRERVSNALTYQPSNPESMSSKVLTAPGRVISGAGEFLGEKADKTGLPYVGSVARGLPLAAASLLGVKAGAGAKFNAKPFGGPAAMAVPERVPGTPAPPEVATPEQTAIKNATDVGYKLSPSQTGNKAGATVEGLSGQAASERLLSKKNVPITDGLAKRALGIDPQAQLTPAKFTELEVKANRAYGEMAKTGVRKTSDEYKKEINSIGDRTGAGSFAEDSPQAVTKLKEIYGGKKAFDARDAVDKIRQLRRDARDNLKPTATPEQKALGNAQRKIAEALDNELERHASDIGKPELASNYKAARVQLAKLHTVKDAVQGTNVSAKKIWQQWKRGAPLEGELLTIARTYDSFQHVLQDASKIRGKHPFSVIDAFVAAGGAAINPALLATVAARPAARAILASDAYQRRFVAPKGGAAKPVNPAGKSTAPAVAVQSRERKAG